jgi:predicted transcriptional regulator
MYLERVPSAYAYEMERDLQLSGSALDPALRSLVERGIVRERCGLYVLSVDGLR